METVFSLSTFLYECGGQRYNSTLVDKVEKRAYRGWERRPSGIDRALQKPGDLAPYGRFAKGIVSVTRPTSRFVQDYNMLSFNSLTLGYDFDMAWMKKAHIGMLRAELSGNDLFHLSTVSNVVWTTRMHALSQLR